MKSEIPPKPHSEFRPSVCPLDCPDRCSLDVEVRDDQVVSIRGSRAHSLTAGYICTKVSRFGRRLYGPDRVLYPLRRTGPKGSGQFARISWPEAIDEVAQRLKAIRDTGGSEAILPFAYGGSNGMLTHEFVDAHFFRRLGASRLARTLCAASTKTAQEALYGKMPGTAFEDYENSRFILIWGASPTHSNIHLVPYLKAARRRGARIATVDPRRHLGGDLVDQHLQIYPGSDVAVALAMMHHLDRQNLVDRDFLRRHSTGWEKLLEYASQFPLERAARLARVAGSEIARLADSYAQATPAVVRCGWGLERNRNGLAAVAAVLALPAIAGKFCRAGGGYTLSNSKAYQVDDDALADAPAAATRTLNMNRLGRDLNGAADPPILALVVYNCNPAATVPDHNRVTEGLRRPDLFTVVLEQVMTDTAAYADVVLPVTTFLEHTELNKSYGAFALQLGAPVLPAQGEAKCNAEIFQLLGRALGWNDGLFALDSEQLLRHALGTVKGPMESALSPEMMRERRIVHFDFPGRRPIQFSTVFPDAPDRKIRLYPETLGPEPYRYLEDPGVAEFPLALISPSSSKSVSSTLAEFNLLDVRLEMHPEDATARGLQDGEPVRVYNELGEVHCKVKLDGRLKPGVVSLPKGMWRRATLNGSLVNALVPDGLTPVSGGACFNDARVEVERLP
jgi:anaerobic selenocysteine-containing dehydrogenase